MSVSSEKKWKVEVFTKDDCGDEADQLSISPGPEMRAWVGSMWNGINGERLHLRVQHLASGAYLTAKVMKQKRTFMAELPHALLKLEEAVKDMKRRLRAKENA